MDPDWQSASKIWAFSLLCPSSGPDASIVDSHWFGQRMVPSILGPLCDRIHLGFGHLGMRLSTYCHMGMEQQEQHQEEYGKVEEEKDGKGGGEKEVEGKPCF